MAVVGEPTGSVVINLMPTAWATTVCAAQAVFCFISGSVEYGQCHDYYTQ